MTQTPSYSACMYISNLCFLFTTEEEHVEGLMRLQDDQVRPKHHTSCLLLIVVHLDCTVAGAAIRHHTCLVTFLAGEWMHTTVLTE